MARINIQATPFEHDPEDPEGYRSGMLRLGPRLGAEQTGMSVYEIPPGQSICPYHYEQADEEWLVVLEGNPTLRHPDGSDTLVAFDVACFPVGPAGAHKVTNETELAVRVMMFSTVRVPAVAVYPDSDKIGIYTADRKDDLIVRRSSAVGYWDGELPGG